MIHISRILEKKKKKNTFIFAVDQSGGYPSLYIYPFLFAVPSLK